MSPRWVRLLPVDPKEGESSPVAPSIPALDLPLQGRPEPAGCLPQEQKYPRKQPPRAWGDCGEPWEPAPLSGTVSPWAHRGSDLIELGGNWKGGGKNMQPLAPSGCSLRGLPRWGRSLVRPPPLCQPCDWAARLGTPRGMEAWTSGPSQIQGPGPELSPQCLRPS